MKKYGVILGGPVILILMAFSMGSWAVGQQAEDAGVNRIPFLVNAAGGAFSARAQQAGNGEIGATQSDSERWVAFFPQDGTTTATVLKLYNTNDAVVGVVLGITRSDGTYDIFPIQMVPYGAYQFCSDRVTSETGWNWIDFGTKVSLGELILPPGVVVDGYIAWNGKWTDTNNNPVNNNTYNPGGATDIYDPSAPLQRMPLQFMEEPPAQPIQ